MDFGRLLMVGCGNMGGVMLHRWLEAGVRPGRVTVVSPSGRTMPDGVTVVPAIPDEADGTYDVILLALKPQQVATLRGGPLADHAPRLLISILAGVEHADLVPLSGATTVLRAMPNMAVETGHGVVALHPVANDVMADMEAMMEPLGLVEWIADEALFDAVTALAGSGPAYVYRFIDALAAAGVALGMPRDVAARLALATVEGAATSAARSDVPPGTLAEQVASPGGSTREGLKVLDEGDALATLVHGTLDAATRRNGELAAAAKG